MGLFGLFKSKKSSQEQEMQKFFVAAVKKLFPNGDREISQHVNELRGLYDYRYPERELTNPYIHVAILYEVSQIKDREQIVNNALQNHITNFTKSEAYILYDFMLKKREMNPTTSLMDKISALSDAEKVILVCQGGVKELGLKYPHHKPSKGGRFEIFIFNVFAVLQDRDDQSLTDGVFSKMVEKGITDYNVSDNAETVLRFIQRRFSFIHEELSTLRRESNYLPMKTYTSFYLSPLKNEIEIGEVPDPFKMLQFYDALMKNMEYCKSGVSNMIG